MNGSAAEAGELDGLLAFLRAAEALKDTLRNSWTSAGRHESAAEHSWRLCLTALSLKDRFDGLDFARLLEMLVVHDLGEALHGDVPAPLQSGAKSLAERRDLLALLDPLPAPAKARLLALWDEYERAETPEARVAKALDKLETCLQHVQGRNPDGFDYAFNLAYGQEWSDADPTVAALRRLVDLETARRAEAVGAGRKGRRGDDGGT